MSNSNERDIDIEQQSPDRVRITTSPHQEITNTDFSPGEQVVNVIPIVEENFTLSKKDVEKEVYLEQRWVSTTKKIEVPIRYQQFYINGKELESYEGMGSIGEMFSKIKEKIKDIISDDDEQNSSGKTDHFNIKYHKEDEMPQEKYDTKGEMVAIQGTRQNEESSLGSGGMNTLPSQTEKERIIPIWEEEVVISKRMAKVGEVVVRKYRVTENQKVDVNIIREKLTIKYPDGNKEEINT